MNDLGITLAWLAVQVTLVVIPALALLAMASRRGPASGAWIATLSLGLISVLSVTGLLVGPARSVRTTPKRATLAEPAQTSTTSPTAHPGTSTADRPSPEPGLGWTFAELRLVWDRLERSTAEPAARCRPWGSVVAVVASLGMGFSMVRLVTGLLAVAAFRRRGRVIDDPEMTDLLDRLRAEMGCSRAVELREADDLTTPATAGWRRPVLLLPDDWRSWNDVERRAVLAHELAHVVRGDYAAGLVARFAVVMNTYHPLVRWMAGRLDIQQEQAADALAARFAGGRAGYLVVLARLALKQDGRSSRWPARGFLPDRGTLIRRIAMLRDQSENETYGRPNSGMWRLLASFTLLSLTIGVATLRGPARAAADDVPATTAKPQVPTANEPIAVPYVPDGSSGVIAFRPAATARQMNTDTLTLLVSDIFDSDLADFAKTHQIDVSKPGFPKPGVEDVEWVTCGIRFGKGRNNERENLHAISLGGLTVRMTSPFDWLAYLRHWRFEMTEVREGGRSYYQMKGPMQPILGPHPCVCVLDDRTAVLDEEQKIREFLSAGVPTKPAVILSPQWRQASRGLLTVAIDNHDGAFAKQYDLGRPDDAIALSLFKNVEHWVFEVDDAATLAFHATAVCRDADSAPPITKGVDSLLKLGKDWVEHADPDSMADAANVRAYRLFKAFLEGLVIQRTDRQIELHTKGFGTLADIASLIESEIKEAKEQHRIAMDKAKSTKR
jgi:beta-lactamase regulating signal transducer with metallopeptidase domain